MGPLIIIDEREPNHWIALLRCSVAPRSRSLLLPNPWRRVIGRLPGDRPRYAYLDLVGSRRSGSSRHYARTALDSSEQTGIGVSAISCWEVAKLVERQRLSLPCSAFDWIRQALAYPGVRLLDLSPRISVESTQLPGTFHRDPADQIIVATARVFDAPLVTLDPKILAYPHVRLTTTP